MRVTDLLGRVDAAGVYEIEPVDEQRFRAARDRLLAKRGTVAVRIRDDEHVKALDKRICGGIAAALRELDADDQVTVPMAVERPKGKRGRALKPRVTRQIVVKRGEVAHLDLRDAYYLLGPDRWGLLFEEVDPSSGASVAEQILNADEDNDSAVRANLDLDPPKPTRRSKRAKSKE